MKTLIELFDDRPIENILATEVFRPEEMILLCPPELVSGQKIKESLETYLAYRNVSVRITIVSVSLLDAAKVEKQIRKILENRKDCAINISGGTETALFAAGKACGDTPVFTFSRKRNTFYEISNAPFARNLPCELQLNAQACFMLAGGKLLPGREDNTDLRNRLPQIDRLFRIFQKYRRIWRRQITWFQRVSSSDPGRLNTEGPFTVRADRSLVTVDQKLLSDLSHAGLISQLHISEDSVRFRFPDEMVRFWLRDIGSVLELQVFRACLAADYFNDVVLSAIVNWEGAASQRDTVTNEIDVVAVRGLWPVFISCKTSEIRTEALNEIAILRDRFGGHGSRAIIATSAPATKSRALMRRRAAEMNIEVIEWDDLPTQRLIERLKQ
ncbi:MAG: DUF1887 family protein [Parasporobacterium sp.]|nr:DUF1887 family protein [Parasporobacterium sp.]